MQTYRIADLTVAFAPRYPTLEMRSRKYAVDTDEAAHELRIPDEVLEKSRAEHSELDENLREYMYMGSAFYQYLLSAQGMMLHASAVVVNERAYLFSAPSGVGKSTHTALWLRHFGEDAYILNDDKPALRVIGDSVYAYGTPFSGKHDISVNRRVRVQGIAFVVRASENHVERKTSHDALYALLDQTVRPPEVAKYLQLLHVVHSILERVPIYTLYCNTELDAVATAWGAMRKDDGHED